MNGINFFDSSVMTFIQTYLHNPVADAVFPVVTYLGEAGFLWLLTSVFFLCRKGTRRRGLCMACAVTAGFLFGEVLLKNVVCRERPFQAFPDFTPLLIAPPSGFSFPSGHSCSSFAAATVLLCFSKKWGVPALIMAALIAFSRVFLFVHWPTDVLCGALLGTAFGLLTYWAAAKWSKKEERPTEQ